MPPAAEVSLRRVNPLAVHQQQTRGQRRRSPTPRRSEPVSADPPVVRVHLTAATLDAAAAVCHVRGLPHLVLLLDRAANEIRQQEGNES